jgi:hypothetical protein
MSDSSIYFYRDNRGDFIPILAHDNGNGTFSLSTYSGTTSSGSTGLTNTELRATDVKVSLDSETVTVLGLSPTVDSSLTGHITVTTSGTAVAGSNVANTGGFFLTVFSPSTALGYFFDSTQTKAAAGFPFNADSMVFVPVANLNVLKFDADTSATIIAFAKA